MLPLRNDMNSAMMKRSQLVFLAVLCIATACLRRGPITTIKVSDGHSLLKIEYSGKVVFNRAGTAITGISPGGYVKYDRDGRVFSASGDERGRVTYFLEGRGANDGVRPEWVKRATADLKQTLDKAGKQ